MQMFQGSLHYPDNHTDFLGEQIEELDTEVAKRLDPFQEHLDRLDTIPGVARDVTVLGNLVPL